MFEASSIRIANLFRAWLPGADADDAQAELDMAISTLSRIGDRLDAWLPGVQAAAARADAELELVAAILAEPAKGIVIAESAGVTPSHFDQPDLQAIFIAAKVAGESGLERVLQIARWALQREGLWDQTQIAGNWRLSMRWSPESLARLAFSNVFNPSLIAHRARQLLSVVSNLADAGEYIKAARRLLEECLPPRTLPIDSEHSAREDAA